MDESIRKVYVSVNANFSPEGILMPRCIVWEDGRKFEISRVKACCRRASLKAGGVGIRYTCVINGKDHYLFYEENNRWFVEGK